MMLDSGAGAKEQIRQLTGMRGLMAKPKKSTAGGGEIIENQFFLTLRRSFYLRVFHFYSRCS
jgi:hypothetical protein